MHVWPQVPNGRELENWYVKCLVKWMCGMYIMLPVWMLHGAHMCSTMDPLADDVSLSSDVLAAEGSRVLQLRSLTVRIRKDMASGVFLQDRDHAGSVCDVTLDHVSFFSSEEQKRGSSTFRSVLDARADVSRIGFRLQRYPLWLPVYERLVCSFFSLLCDSCLYFLSFLVFPFFGVIRERNRS